MAELWFVNALMCDFPPFFLSVLVGQQDETPEGSSLQQWLLGQHWGERDVGERWGGHGPLPRPPLLGGGARPLRLHLPLQEGGGGRGLQRLQPMASVSGVGWGCGMVENCVTFSLNLATAEDRSHDQLRAN